jgi:hypothetical protein
MHAHHRTYILCDSILDLKNLMFSLSFKVRKLSRFPLRRRNRDCIRRIRPQRTALRVLADGNVCIDQFDQVRGHAHMEHRPKRGICPSLTDQSNCLVILSIDGLPSKSSTVVASMDRTTGKHVAPTCPTRVARSQASVQPKATRPSQTAAMRPLLPGST